jgi:hypothetical protein
MAPLRLTSRDLVCINGTLTHQEDTAEHHTGADDFWHGTYLCSQSTTIT